MDMSEILLVLVEGFKHCSEVQGKILAVKLLKPLLVCLHDRIQVGIMDVLKVGRSTVYALLNRNDFPATRIGKRILVSETALHEWLEAGGTARDDAV